MFRTFRRTIRVHGVLQTVETEFKYAGYIAQQERQVARLKMRNVGGFPQSFRYRGIPAFQRGREKLGRVRPETLGQAGRFPASRRPRSRFWMFI